MKYKLLASFFLPPLTLICDLVAFHFFEAPLLQTTFFSLIIVILLTRSWKYLLVSFLCLGLFSTLLYDSFFFLLYCAFPIALIMHYSATFFRSKLVIGAFSYSFYISILFFIIPLFILKTPTLPPYTFLAFSGNLIGASLSLKLLPIVE